ncbi:MAG: SpoIIE family protein phosphatase [Bryobacteraceae bacterium]|nr:SpoIIE family protein phosphatase [Bryobacteraceae bacterium]
MLMRWMSPFAGDSTRKALIWFAVLALAPFAYWLGLSLRVPQVREPHIDSAEALRRAVDFGRTLGLNVSDWSPAIHPTLGAEHAVLARTEAWRTLPQERKLLAPITTIRVVLIAPDKQRWLAVWLRPDGALHGFDMSTNLLALGNVPPESESRALALAEAKRAFPGHAWGEPEVESAAVEGSHAARRYLWNTPVMPGLESTLTVEVHCDRITERTLKLKVNRGELPVRESRANGIVSGLAGVALALGVLYSIYRFSRRSLEREISWTRSAVMVGAMTMFGIFVAVADPTMGDGALNPDQMISPFAMLIPLSVVLSSTLQGILIALVYGAGEGEMRESYPGKITSLDALFSGYVTSANVGRSVVTGAAAGGWAFLAIRLVQKAAGSSDLRERLLGMVYGRSPGLISVMGDPITAFFIACICLLLPLLYLSRHLGQSLLRRFLAILFCLLGAVSSGFSINFDEPSSIAVPVLIAALALVTFWIGDFLAVVVALGWFFVFLHNHEITDVVAGWAATEYRIYGLAVASACFALIAVYRGRKLSDAEVRPQHAHRLQERLQLEQEVSAAREAQVRLLPEGVPEIPGFGLAASCHPAREVGGDFYDFFRLSRNRYGILVADGSSGGLASALTIGLAKGFLSYAALRDWPPAQALERLEPVLTQAISSTAHHFSLCYAVLDPSLGELRFARIGQHPRLFHMRGQARAIEEVKPRTAGAETRLQLGPGDLFLFCTDGLVSRLEARLGCRLDAWLDGGLSKTAERFHADLMQAVQASGHDLQDDITAVVVEMQVPQLQAGSSVALRGVA